MALDKADLELLGQFIDQRISGVIGDLEANREQKNAEKAAQNRDSVVGVPDVHPDSGPMFYVHLANGEVVESRDSSSTHVANSEGEPIQVIGRYQKGQ